jgi:transcriptional regulator with XRE-family HTH domain
MTVIPSLHVTSSQRALRSHVAEEVRVGLARRRMSGVELARRIGKSHTYVWRRLTGETAFDLDDIERIAAVLGVDAVDLFPRPNAQVNDSLERGVRRTYLPPAVQPMPDRPTDNRPPGVPRTRPGDSTRRPRRLSPPPVDPVIPRQRPVKGTHGQYGRSPRPVAA